VGVGVAREKLKEHEKEELAEVMADAQAP